LRRLLPLLVVALYSACDSEGPPEPRSSVRPLAARLEQAPRVALIATRPGASESSLHFVRAGSASPAPALLSFAHAPDGEVRGALLSGGERAVVVADMERRREPSFGAWLLALEAGHEPRVLAKHCYHASRPLVLPSGNVLVQRGEPGPEPEPTQGENGELRKDLLSIDEVDPQTGAVRTVHDFQGYITHLAGALGGEVFVYRVRHQHADLIAIDVETTSVRALAASLPAQARDFSVDVASRSLVYANHDGSGWLIERLDLESGARKELARADGMWVTPSVWPAGGVLVNDGRGATPLSGVGPMRPLGPGFDEVRAVSEDGRFVALLHRAPADFARAFVTSAGGERVLGVPAPAGARVEVLGVLP